MLDPVGASQTLVLLGVVSQSATWLYSRETVMGGELLAGSSVRFFYGRTIGRLMWLWDERRWVLLQWLKIFLCVWGIVQGFAGVAVGVPFSILFVIALAERYRLPFGDTGAEQQLFIMLLAHCILCAFDSGDVGFFVRLFVVGQLVLCYAVSGSAKARSPRWRSGQALIDIMSTGSYGRPALFRFLREHPRLSQWSSWLVFIWMCTFPLVFFLPRGVALVWCIVGVWFHLANALVMGLTTFFFAFLAAYPFLLGVLQH